MKLSAKLLTPLFFAFLAPLASQAQFMRGGSNSQNKAPQASADSVQLKFMGGESRDTIFNVSPDSAAAMLKATHAQVFFIDHVRSPKKKLAKLVPGDLISIEVAYGSPLVRQYGDEAEEGVVTILTKVKPKPAPQPAQSPAPKQGHAKGAKQP